MGEIMLTVAFLYETPRALENKRTCHFHEWENGNISKSKASWGLLYGICRAFLLQSFFAFPNEIVDTDKKEIS